jgi:hypothetical protein
MLNKIESHNLNKNLTNLKFLWLTDDKWVNNWLLQLTLIKNDLFTDDSRYPLDHKTVFRLVSRKTWI